LGYCKVEEEEQKYPLPTPGGGSSTSNRVEEILSKEPVIEKPAAISFGPKLNQHPHIHTFINCSAAHGTNLAAALSALRNTIGQLVPINRLEKLGRLWASGATPVNRVFFL